MGKKWKQCQILYFYSPKSQQMVTAVAKLKRLLLLGRKVITNPDSIWKSRDITLPTKVHLVKAMVFPIVMYRYEPKNLCFWIVMLEKTLESPLDNKEIKPINLKGNQPWIFTGRTDVEAAILWSLMRRDNSLEKILMLGKIAGGKGGD